jgi:uronate dehydrogenase
MVRDIKSETWGITGGAGRIAGVLRPALLERLAGLVLLDVNPIVDARPGERVVTCDLSDVEVLREAFTGVAGVIHLAAIPDEADFRDLVESNVIGTANVLEAARQAGVQRIVFASTGRTMGMYEASDAPLDPGMRVRPDSFYGVSKVAGEALCSLYVDKFGMRATCLRIGAFKAEPEDTRDLGIWLSHDDVVEAVRAGMEHEGPAFSILIAYSDNRQGFADTASWREVGYLPKDDAADHFAGEPPQGPIAGPMATAEYTLSRQKAR